MLKKNFILVVVIMLDLAITILSLVLGCLMHASNEKSIIQNQVYVELTDFISNIEYGLHFGKSLESYYGMEEELKDVLDNTDSIDRLYIVDTRGDILFRTADEPLSKEVSNMSGKSNQKNGNDLYCAFDFATDARLIAHSDISGQTKEWRAYYMHLLLVALAGFIVSAGLMFLVYRHISNAKKSYYLMIAVLLLWIVTISSIVGYGAYTRYRMSISKLDDVIERNIISDVEWVHDQGVKDEDISGVNTYLERYSDNISEIEKIKRDRNDFVFEISESYMRRKLLDYLLQTLLFLAFSSMILAEYQIFMSGTGMNERKEDSNAGA